MSFKGKEVITGLIFLFILTSCTTAQIVKEVIPSEEGNVDVFFCPETNCSDEFVRLAEGKDVKCAFYDIDLEEIKEIVKTAVVDNTNKVEDINAIEDTGYALMHNKFCVIDSSIVWTGSFNPTYNDNYKNNNNVIVIHSNYLARNYIDEYNELSNEMFGGGYKVKYPKIIVNGIEIENYFCPEDRCQQHILDELNSAEESVYFMEFTFTDREIAQLLVQKSKNIKVMGVMEKRNAFSQYSQFFAMNSSFAVAIDKNKNNMHHKVFIIDNSTVITGSMNPTKSANEKNDENIIIIHDKAIAGMYVEEFEKLIK